MGYAKSLKLQATGADVETLVRSRCMLACLVEREGTDTAFSLRIRLYVTYSDDGRDLRFTYAVGLQVASWSDGTADVRLWTEPPPPLPGAEKIEKWWERRAASIADTLESTFPANAKAGKVESSVTVKKLSAPRPRKKAKGNSHQGRQSEYSLAKRDETVEGWMEKGPKDARTLAVYLSTIFGDKDDDAMSPTPIVARSTFYDWRKDYLRRHPKRTRRR